MSLFMEAPSSLFAIAIINHSIIWSPLVLPGPDAYSLLALYRDGAPLRRDDACLDSSVCYSVPSKYGRPNLQLESNAAELLLSPQLGSHPILTNSWSSIREELMCKGQFMSSSLLRVTSEGSGPCINLLYLLDYHMLLMIINPKIPLWHAVWLCSIHYFSAHVNSTHGRYQGFLFLPCCFAISQCKMLTKCLGDSS